MQLPTYEEVSQTTAVKVDFCEAQIIENKQST